MKIRKGLFALLLVVFASTFFIKPIKAAPFTAPTIYTEIETIEELLGAGTAASAFYEGNRIWFFDLNGDAYLYYLKQAFNTTLLIDAKAAYTAETGQTPAFITTKPQLQDAYYLAWVYNHGEGAEVDFQFALWNSSGQITGYWTWTYTVRTSHGIGYQDNIVPLIDSGSGSLVASRNLAVPDLTGKTILENGQYRLQSNNNTLFLDYDKVTGIYKYHGTDTSNITPNGVEILSLRNLLRADTTSSFSIRIEKVTGNLTVGGYIAVTNTSKGTIQYTGPLFINENFIFSSSSTMIIRTQHGDIVDISFKIQIEKSTTSTIWMHPDSIYYSTASIQHDQYPASVSQIMSNVYAIDDVDGNITDRIQVVDTAREYAAVLANRWKLNVNDTLAAYDANTLNVQITNTITLTKAYVDSQFATYQSSTYWYALNNSTLIPLGLTQAYKFMAYVGDTAGNYTFLEINVFVSDVTAPVWSASNILTISVGYKVTYDLNTWLQSLIVTDNYDTSVTLTIVTDNYTSNKAVLGSHTVIVRATDDSGNTADKTFTFTVIDNIKPVFSGPETIYKPQSGTMTINDIKVRFTAFDEISGNVTSRITVTTDTYTGNGHISGTYWVTLKVTDLNGNEQFLTFPVIVRDDIPPVLYVADGYFITVSSAYNLTLEGIKDILVATGRLEIVSTTWYDVVIDEYTGNENKPGIYTVSIRFSQTSGVTEVHSVAVNVVNTSGGTGGIIDGPSSSINIWLIVGGVGLTFAVVFFIFRRK